MSQVSHELSQQEQDLVDQIYEHAASLMRDGHSNDTIVKDLVENGLDADAAHAVVQNLDALRNDQAKSEGKKNMVFGALWCIGGAMITAVTYGAASSGGGTYVVAWGAILFGAVQFIQGLSQIAGDK